MSGDIVNSLLRKRFGSRVKSEKCDILRNGRPKPKILNDRKDGKVKRGFNADWYQKVDWLCGSSLKQRLFCWPCLLLSNKSSPWTTLGFIDMQNLARGIHSHELCTDHIRCELKFKRLLRRQPNVEEHSEQKREENEMFNENVKKNREIFKRMVDATMMLSFQEQGSYGHDESSESEKRGDCSEFLEYTLKHSPELYRHWKANKAFTAESKTIQNELIECIHDELYEMIQEEIKSAACVSIDADECTDVSHRSQLVVVIRYVDNEGNPQERLLRVIDVSEKRDAEAACDAIVQCLEDFGMREKLVAQTYDGASVMAGDTGCIQRRMKEFAPQALFTHCHARRLNLVLQNGARALKEPRIFFCALSGISSFFSKSSRRTAHLESKLKRPIPIVSGTRWSSNAKTVAFVCDNYSKLLEVFRAIRDDSSWDVETTRQAVELLSMMHNSDFTFMMHLYGEVLERTEIAFAELQRKNLDIGFCAKCIAKTAEFLKELNTGANFERIAKKAANDEAVENPDESRTSRRARSEEERRTLFREVLENLSKQLELRFKDLDKIRFVELGDTSRFSEFAESFPEAGLLSLENAYPREFDIPRLRNELKVIYEDDERKQSVHELVKDLLSCGAKNTFMEAYKLFCLILTIPSTSVAAVRSFSCVERVKTAIRNSVTSVHSSFLMKMSVEKKTLELLEKLPDWYDKIIDRFSKSKTRRMELSYRELTPYVSAVQRASSLCV